jgi:putative hydrolase of the HAD superfamily
MAQAGLPRLLRDKICGSGITVDRPVRPVRHDLQSREHGGLSAFDDQQSLSGHGRVIKTVLFDLDGTLYDRDALVRSLAADQYLRFRDELQHVEQAQYVRRLVALDDHGYTPKEQVYAGLSREFRLEASLGQRLMTHFWSVYDDFCSVSDDTLETLELLRFRGKKLGIITNGRSERQQAKIDALGIRSFFDAIVVSEEEGVRKPDARIFLRALERCSASPARALYVGDHPRADVEGALNAGLSAAWKAVPYWRLNLARVPSIDRLSDVLDLVDD